MRYSLLRLIACPHCRLPLTCYPWHETPLCGRDVHALPDDRELTDEPGILTVETGVLTCASCSRWFPVRGSIPELLPDHLRDWAHDRAWLAQYRAQLSPETAEAALSYSPPAGHTDAGEGYKRAEITVPEKIVDDGFWGPGYTSPFNPRDPEHGWHLIRSFAVAQPLLELPTHGIALDAGSGFCWTTEWMLRSGYEAVGIDICRKYLEIGLARVGPHRPHMIVADVEHLPLRSPVVHAVLGFEAFHHVPDRPAAMREFARVLRADGVVVLVEPGGAHEHAEVSVHAMQTYGTLEKGMDLADVEQYAAGSGLAACRQHTLLRHIDEPPGPEGLRVISNEIYTLRKTVTAPPASTSWRLRAMRLWAGVQRDRLRRIAGAGSAPPPVVRMAIDSPSESDSGVGILLTGWALDAQAAFGSGIGTVHAWARQVDRPGVTDMFLGVARLGEPRRDVSAVFGAQFRLSGYHLAVQLPAGTYAVTVHAWCDRTARWEDARTVTVSVR